MKNHQEPPLEFENQKIIDTDHRKKLSCYRQSFSIFGNNFEITEQLPSTTNADSADITHNEPSISSVKQLKIENHLHELSIEGHIFQISNMK